MSKLEAGLVRAEEIFVCLLLLGMTGLAFAEVLLRGLFHIGLPWANILLRQAVLWVALVGASLAASQKRHIKLDVLLRLMPSKPARRVGGAIDLLAAAVCLVLTRAAWVFVASEREFGTLLYGEIPAWPFQIILPAGFGLLALKFLLRFEESLHPTPGRGRRA